MQMKYEYVFNDLSALEIEYKLRQIIENALYQKYGDKPDELIRKRIIDEWAAMERSDRENPKFCVNSIYQCRNEYFYRQGTGDLLFPCSHYNGNTVPVSSGKRREPLFIFPLMPGRFAVSRAFDPQNRLPDWNKFYPNLAICFFVMDQPVS